MKVQKQRKKQSKQRKKRKKIRRQLRRGDEIREQTTSNKGRSKGCQEKGKNMTPDERRYDESTNN